MILKARICTISTSFVLAIHSETLKITILACRVVETLEVDSETNDVRKVRTKR